MVTNRKIEVAKQNHLKIIDLFKKGKLRHTSTKYRFFASAIQRQSEQYLYEAETPTKKYWKFSRGSLIFIEFGVNVGGELSNNHWAIVLDKQDSPYKKTLTVIPITSKESKGTIPIKEIIGEQPLSFIYEQLEQLERQLEDDNADIEKIKIQLKQSKEIIDYYSRYLKQSYAKCDSIQTISKDRILRKNPLDPIGKIKVSPETLDKINDKFKEIFLNWLDTDI